MRIAKRKLLVLSSNADVAAGEKRLCCLPTPTCGFETLPAPATEYTMW